MCFMFIVGDGYTLNVSYMMFGLSLSGNFRVKASCGSRMTILVSAKFAARTTVRGAYCSVLTCSRREQGDAARRLRKLFSSRRERVVRRAYCIDVLWKMLFSLNDHNLSSVSPNRCRLRR